MIKYLDAIVAINPDAKVIIKNEDLNEISWLDDTTPISKEDIQTKYDELVANYDNNKYQRDRATAYPSIQDQLDMQYWDNVNGTTNWKDAIAKVKSDNPKP